MLSSRRSFLSALGSGGLALAGEACATRRAPAIAPSPVLPAPGPVDAPAGVIRIGSNENPYGPGAAALAAIREAIPESHRYSFGASAETAAAIAAHLRVPRDHVALGCGSSEILQAAVSAFTSRDSGLVTASPSFELPAEWAASAGAPVSDVPVDARGRLDLDAMLDRAAGAGLAYVCNPNNPTSTVHGAADVRAFIEQVHRQSPTCTVLIDEAYHDYVDAADYETAIPIAVSDSRVLVIRTFSKIHAMAGLRVGYAVGQPSTVRRLRPSLGGMTMSVLSAAAARASLADAAHVEQQRALNREARAFTLAALAKSGCTAFESQANFVMVDVGRDCRAFAAACASRGVRVARSFPALANHARITVGTMAEMRQAAGVFAEVLAAPSPVTALWPRPSWVDHVVPEC